MSLLSQFAEELAACRTVASQARDAASGEEARAVGRDWATPRDAAAPRQPREDAAIRHTELTATQPRRRKRARNAPDAQPADGQSGAHQLDTRADARLAKRARSATPRWLSQPWAVLSQECEAAGNERSTFDDDQDDEDDQDGGGGSSGDHNVEAGGSARGRDAGCAQPSALATAEPQHPTSCLASAVAPLRILLDIGSDATADDGASTGHVSPWLASTPPPFEPPHVWPTPARMPPAAAPRLVEPAHPPRPPAAVSEPVLASMAGRGDAEHARAQLLRAPGWHARWRMGRLHTRPSDSAQHTFYARLLAGGVAAFELVCCRLSSGAARVLCFYTQPGSAAVLLEAPLLQPALHFARDCARLDLLDGAAGWAVMQYAFRLTLLPCLLRATLRSQ